MVSHIKVSGRVLIFHNPREHHRPSEDVGPYAQPSLDKFWNCARASARQYGTASEAHTCQPSTSSSHPIPMNFFKTKPRTPPDLVRGLRDAIPKLESSPPGSEARRKASKSRFVIWLLATTVELHRLGERGGFEESTADKGDIVWRWRYIVWLVMCSQTTYLTITSPLCRTCP